MSVGQVEKKALTKSAYSAKNDVNINYCLVGDRYPVEEFIASLTTAERDSVIALFKLFGEKKGRIFNQQKYKKLEQNTYEAVFEFKDYQVRIACITRPGYNFNLIYGFKKKKGGWPQSDLKAMRNNCQIFNEEEKLREKEKLKAEKNKKTKRKK